MYAVKAMRRLFFPGHGLQASPHHVVQLAEMHQAACYAIVMTLWAHHACRHLSSRTIAYVCVALYMLVVVLVIVLRRKLQRWPFPQSCKTQLGVLLLRACHAASMPSTLLGLKSRPEHSCRLQAIISQSNLPHQLVQLNSL